MTLILITRKKMNKLKINNSFQIHQMLKENHCP